MQNETELIAAGIQKYIIGEVNKVIDTRKLETYLPHVSKEGTLALLNDTLYSMNMYPQIRNYEGLKEEHVSEVSVLLRDNLMMQEVESENQSVIDNKEFEEKPKISIHKRSTINSCHSSFKKEKTITLSARKNKQIQSPFFSISEEIQEDPEAAKYRKYRSQQIKQVNKEKRAASEKQKSIKDKRDSFTKEYESKECTFDFDGEAIAQREKDDLEKINFYGMKTKFSEISKTAEYEEINKEFYVPNKRIKNSNSFEEKNSTIAISSIPVFKKENPNNTIQINSYLESCKLEEFKKYHSGRFVKLSKSINNTLDENDKETHKNDPLDHILSSRTSISHNNHYEDKRKPSETSNKESKTKMKLALPKIHGKYSTLDKYEYC